MGAPLEAGTARALGIVSRRALWARLSSPRTLADLAVSDYLAPVQAT